MSSPIFHPTQFYTLFWSLGSYSDKVVYYCGTFSSKETAEAHRSKLLENSRADKRYESGDPDEFVLLRTDLDQGVQIDAEYDEQDLFKDERDRRRADEQRRAECLA